MTKHDTLLGAVADAIATADVDGATYEDLARAALDANKMIQNQNAMQAHDMAMNTHLLQSNWIALNKEDDGA